MQIPVYEKRGYLNEDYRFFAISAKGLPKMNYHYHEFHKLLFLRDGSAGYSIEGRHYDLERNDIVIIPAGCVHRPEVEEDNMYSRYVLYVSPSFLKTHSTEQTELESLFHMSGGSVARTAGDTLGRLKHLFRELEDNEGGSFGNDVLTSGIVLQITVLLTRWMRGPKISVEGIANDKKILSILQYINENIHTDLSIDSIADEFYISKFHMMRRFREETGYTVHSYITNKRLINAKQLIADGEAATEVCYKCGFRDYSTFSRAYKKLFDESPAGRRKKEKE
ncbi:MAG: AraC family transcriptional regulator [Oscillospiraceae bacterium]|nr:AraC family transcriptional regulator [Oscillospiraceae bacterium]